MASRKTALLRIAIIGIGDMGAAHLRAARSSDRVKTIIACDGDQHVIDHQHIVDPSLPLTLHWEHVRDRDDVDAVIVSLPHDLYVEIVPALLAAGHHVLMEKPFGRTSAEAQTMADAAKKAGKVLMIGGQGKFTPGFQRAKRVLSDGLLGDIFLVRGVTVYRWGHEQDWRWRAERARSGGVAVLDAGWHVLEQVVALHGVPEKVYAASGTKKGVPGKQYDVDDDAALVLHYADGSLGQVLSCFVTSPYEWRILLHGTKGSLELEKGHMRLEFGEGSPSIERFADADLVVAQLDHFVNVVQRGVRSIAGPENALKVMRLIDAAYRSIESGKAEAV